MNIFSKNFELERYGVKVRLVTEQDVSFILSLRTDKRLSRYLHKTDNDLVKQLEWMKAYKERERKGEDYYFIYTNDDGPFGLNRIYDIHGDCGTGGSWLCKPDTPGESDTRGIPCGGAVSERPVQRWLGRKSGTTGDQGRRR